MEFTVAQAKRRARLRRQFLLTRCYVVWTRLTDEDRAGIARAFRTTTWGLD